MNNNILPISDDLKSHISKCISDINRDYGINFSNPAVIIPDEMDKLWPNYIEIDNVKIPVYLRSHFPEDVIAAMLPTNEILVVGLK